MLSIKTLLFLKTLPLTFIYMSWYMCLSIFLDSLYLRSRRLSTRILLIQRILVGSLASLVPLRLPYPECRPFLLASFIRRARDLE
uniref:Uncharacterized protein n=1 Tax=Lotus japonicus TaxID=34305 RepID=I3STX6_LOTJA|nr:unknown [Lotus japonicus]